MTHRVTHHHQLLGTTKDQEQNPPQEQVENTSHTLATGYVLLVARTRGTELQQQEINFHQIDRVVAAG